MSQNMSKEEQRKAHREKRNAHNAKKMRLVYIALIVVFAAIGVAVSFAFFFHVNTIEIRGYSIYTDDEITAVSGARIDDNLFLINRDKVREHIITKLPYIGEVTVRLSLPSKLVITVYETSGVAVAASGNMLVLLNENGKVLGEADSVEAFYENGVLENGKELERDTDEIREVTETEEEEPGENLSPEAGTGEPAAEGQPEGSESAAGAVPEQENAEGTGTGELIYATPDGNVSQSGEKEPEKEQTVYVLHSPELVLLKDVKITSAKAGRTAVFEPDKTLGVYSEIMNLFIENSITGITELNLKDIFNITMKYEDRILVKVGSVTNLSEKMAFAARVIKDQDDAEPNQKGVIDLTIDKKAYFQPETTKKAQITEEGGEVTPGQENEQTTEPTTEPEEEIITNSSGQRIQVARTTTKQTTAKQP